MSDGKQGAGLDFSNCWVLQCWAAGCCCRGFGGSTVSAVCCLLSALCSLPQPSFRLLLLTYLVTHGAAVSHSKRRGLRAAGVTATATRAMTMLFSYPSSTASHLCLLPAVCHELG